MNSKFWLLQYQEIYFKYILEKMLKGKGFMSYHEYKAKKGIKISLNIFLFILLSYNFINNKNS